jgi:hypothetical protein
MSTLTGQSLFAALAAETKIERFFHLPALPAVVDGAAVHHLEQQLARWPTAAAGNRLSASNSVR